MRYNSRKPVVPVVPHPIEYLPLEGAILAIEATKMDPKICELLKAILMRIG